MLTGNYCACHWLVITVEYYTTCSTQTWNHCLFTNPIWFHYYIQVTSIQGKHIQTRICCGFTGQGQHPSRYWRWAFEGGSHVPWSRDSSCWLILLKCCEVEFPNVFIVATLGDSALILIGELPTSLYTFISAVKHLNVRNVFLVFSSNNDRGQLLCQWTCPCVLSCSWPMALLKSLLPNGAPCIASNVRKSRGMNLVNMTLFEYVHGKSWANIYLGTSWKAFLTRDVAMVWSNSPSLGPVT